MIDSHSCRFFDNHMLAKMFLNLISLHYIINLMVLSNTYMAWFIHACTYASPIPFSIIFLFFFLKLAFFYAWVIPLLRHLLIHGRMWLELFSNQQYNSFQCIGSISFRQFLIIALQLFCIDACSTFPFHHLPLFLMHIQNIEFPIVFHCVVAF